MSETEPVKHENDEPPKGDSSPKTNSENDETDDHDSADGTEVGSEIQTEGLSKRQQKRIKKHERWLQLKAEKRKEEKLKKKRKFAEARERGDLGPSRKALKRNSMQNSGCKTKVVIDCSFDDFMSEKDVRHLVQQIQHSYSANRRADNPLQFYVCGVNGKAEKRLEQIGDYKGWDVYMKTENYLDIFPKESVVYLSSDSPTVLQELDDSKVYIIGGLVDHNHHKGLCHELAEEKGVSHAQLPITEYIDMKTRKVLTVNHVFEILLRYTESKDWRKAFFQVLPQRKGMKAKEGQEEQEQTEKQSTQECSSVQSEPSQLLDSAQSELSTEPAQSEPANTTNNQTLCRQSEHKHVESNSELGHNELDSVDTVRREETPSTTAQETVPLSNESS